MSLAKLAAVLLVLVLAAAGAAILPDQQPPEEKVAPTVRATAENRPATADVFSDPLPPGVLARCGTVRLRHHGSVRVLTFAPDGKTLVSGGEGEGLLVWDVATGKPVRSLGGKLNWVQSISFSADGKRLAVGALAAVVVLEVATGKELLRLAAGRAALSADGKTLATTTRKRVVRVWDVNAAKEKHRLGGFQGQVTALVITPDGQQVAAAGADGAVLVWSAVTGKELFRPDAGKTEALAYDSKGKLLATGGEHGTVWLWDAAAGKRLRRLAEYPSIVRALAFAPDGSLLASGYWSRVLDLTDPRSGKEIRTLAGHQDGINCLAFSPDGRTLASTSMGDSKVHVWETATGRERVALPGQEQMAWALAFAPDGKTLAVGGLGRTIQLWDWPTGRQLGLVSGHRGWVLSLAFSADGKRLVSGSSDTTALVWDAHRLRAAAPPALRLPVKQSDK